MSSFSLRKKGFSRPVMGCGLDDFFFFFFLCGEKTRMFERVFDPLPHQRLYSANSQSPSVSRAGENVQSPFQISLPCRGISP